MGEGVVVMSEQVWKAHDYDRQLSFVSAYGKGVVELLAPQPGERILDLGCGTGDLANEISASGAHVTGMDDSAEMIERAKSKYPGLTFLAGDGENFDTESPYDAVFSNAALHWMKDAGGVVRSVYGALKPGWPIRSGVWRQGEHRRNLPSFENGVRRPLWNGCRHPKSVVFSQLGPIYDLA